MVVFYTGIILFFVISSSCLYSKKGSLRYLQSAVSAAVLFLALAAVISFVSPYIYELPTHHCPFGLLPGVFQPLKRLPSFEGIIDSIERKWVGGSMGCMLIFITVVTYQVVMSNLTLNPY